MIEKSSHLYQVVVFDEDDNATLLSDDCTSVYYRNQVNHVGICIVTVPEDHPLVTAVALDTMIEVFISIPVTYGGATGQCRWYSDFQGLYRDRQIATDQDGNTYYLLYFPSLNEILSRYVNAWPAGVDGKTSWEACSYSLIADNLVQWNATSYALTDNGRLGDVSPVRGITAHGPATLTPEVDYAMIGRNILDTMQELATAGGFDFLVTRLYGFHTLTVYQYLGQLGTDRSDDIIFCLHLDNMDKASYGGDAVTERTAAIVAGQGEGSGRTFSAVYGRNYNTRNEYEIFVDARDKSATELEAVGEMRLAELASEARLTAVLSPSLGYMYKRDFVLGDLVTVIFGDVSVTRKIGLVEVTFDQSQEVSIKIGLTDRTP